MTKQEIQDRKNIAQREILEAEAYLSRTDYIAAKLAEGAAEKSEYQEKLSMRQECRDVINRENALIAELDKIVPEEESSSAE